MAIETSGDMRSFLISQMENVSEGKIEVNQAKAICNFAQQIYNTIQIEIKFSTIKHKTGESLEVIKWS